MSSFVLTKEFLQSHKMGTAQLTLEKAVKKFGNDGLGQGDKTTYEANGVFTAPDGIACFASFWDYKGSFDLGYVSVWVANPMLLNEFIQFIERE